MSRRSRTQVIYTILKVTANGHSQGGVRKTTIMYKSNLNFFRLSRYFGKLQKEGFIEASKNSPVVYCLTERGKELLRAIEKAQNMTEL